MDGNCLGVKNLKIFLPFHGIVCGDGIFAVTAEDIGFKFRLLLTAEDIQV